MTMRHHIAQSAAIAMILMCDIVAAQQTPPRGASSEPPPALNGPVVKTEQGKVQGFIANDVAIFRGIPFAAPPVGDLRWREPKAAAKWSAFYCG